MRVISAAPNSSAPVLVQQTEIGALPLDWSVVPLITLAEKIMVGIASAATHAYRNAGVVMFRNQNIRPGLLDTEDVLYIAPEYEQTYKNKRLRAGDLLTARTGYPGTTSLVPAGFDGSQSFTTLITRPRSSAVDARYLCLYVNGRSGQKYFEQAQIGGGQKNVNAAALKLLPVALPGTETEQRAIADALTDADTLIDSLKQLLTKKRQIKQGAMQELLTGKRRLPGFAQPWISRTFADVATVSRERVNPIALNTPPLCIELEHLESNTGRLSGEAFESKQAATKSIFRRGDVLFGKLRAYLRKYWLAEFDGVCSTEIWVFRSRGELGSNVYLFYTIQREDFIDAASTAYGTHMPRSDWKIVAEFNLALPSDATEQAAIAQVLTDMDAEIAALESRLTKARAQKHAMAQALLTGRIRLVETKA